MSPTFNQREHYWNDTVSLLTYRQEGHLGWVTLTNAPYNVLAQPVFADLAELRSFLATPSLKGVILAGAGRHFCGGADVDALQEQGRDPDVLGPQLDAGKALLDEISFATVPVLAMVRGACLGAGLEIALACHYRIASENAVFGFPEVEHGVMPGFGASVLAREHRVRLSVVDLVLSGRMIRGGEALEGGLIDQVVPTSDLESKSEAFICSLVDGRSHAVIRAVMESLNNARRLSREDALRRETELFCQLAQASFSKGSE